MKSIALCSAVAKLTVTLHVRVWIEICSSAAAMSLNSVTLHVRVWIEIPFQLLTALMSPGHPPREGVD